MQEQSSRYAVGLDVGTTAVRCVVGHADGNSPVPTIIGVGSVPNTGMRKGVVVNMANTAQAIDKALEMAERMSGHQVNEVTASINGAHILGMSSRGVVAVGTQGHEISEEDLVRAEEAATVVQLPPNREILQVTPRSFKLDEQENIKDPVGMTGVRLEIDAYVITALTPNVKNLQKACEMTKTNASQMVVASLAGSRACLSEQQMENGVILIDFGGTTTNIAVFEEGDLQHVAVLPYGSVHVTNDLAIGLRTDLEAAEAIKLQYASANGSGKEAPKELTIKSGKEEHTFKTKDMDMVVEARLEEIFDLVREQLKLIGRDKKLPGGAVLVGGGARLNGLPEFVKDYLQLPARTGKLSGFSGVADKVDSPAYAAGIGLMLLDLEGVPSTGVQRGSERSPGLNTALKGATGGFRNLLKKLRT